MNNNNNNDTNDNLIEGDLPRATPNTELIKCPVCNAEFQIFEFFTHIYITHEAFLAAWASLAFPIVAETNYDQNIAGITQFFRTLGIRDQSFYGGLFEDQQNIQYDQANDPFDELSYEQLMSMCDEIGYHKVGIKNVDELAPAIVRMRKTTDTSINDRCPICLEDMHKALYMREIKACKHTFCGECIEKWFVENKTCPICKLILFDPVEEVDIKKENDEDNEEDVPNLIDRV